MNENIKKKKKEPKTFIFFFIFKSQSNLQENY